MISSRQFHIRKAVQTISFGVLIGIVAVLVLAVLFIKLADEVVEQEFLSFDRAALLAIHTQASPSLTTAMRIISDFGSPYLLPLAILSLVIGLYVVWQSKIQERAGIIVAIMNAFAPTFALGGALLLTVMVKAIVGRARPDVFPPLAPETGFSFPSGHVLGSIAFYGMVAFLLARPARAWLRAIIIIAALAIIGAIAYSRMYLGVHYPTDVMGSALLGIAWLLSVIIGLDITQSHLARAYRLGQQQEEKVAPAS